MNEALNFEEALAELERIVHDLEEGKIGLDESLARFEQGVALLRHCSGKLGQAEQRIVELLGLDENGQPVTRPFEHTASALKKS